MSNAKCQKKSKCLNVKYYDLSFQMMINVMRLANYHIFFHKPRHSCNQNSLTLGFGVSFGIGIWTLVIKP